MGGTLPVLGATEADMAATLLDLADELRSARVPRTRVRVEWAADHPEHVGGRPAVARHDGTVTPELGDRGRRRVASALTALERHGMIRRDGDRVEILDRDALERLADT